MAWKSSKLLHLILMYVMLSGITFWLPVTRGLFDGSSYTWSGWMGIGGTGIDGQYWLLLMFTALMTSVVFLGWRGARKPFHWLLMIWFILLVTESGSWFFSPESVHLQGDTLGTDLSLSKVIFPFDVLFLTLSCVWISRDIRSKREPQPPAWNRVNRMLLILFFSILPMQFILLGFFDSNILFDQIGVILTILQWILLNLSFYPWRIRAREIPHIHHNS
ncbi:hypothetical protein [Cohnella yongneupensis]|uniref:DUF998 domain-containing protein n=1 Tax=Cohnella yongneupensis TaxID=425006 RepID=A0ABW0QXH3_9BACL